MSGVRIPPPLPTLCVSCSFPYQPRQRVEPDRVIVQGGNDDQLASAGREERLAQADPDLLQGLETVRGEPGRRNEQLAMPSCESADDLVRERTEPTRPEARLEGERPAPLGEAELAREGARGSLALSSIGIA